MFRQLSLALFLAFIFSAPAPIALNQIEPAAAAKKSKKASKRKKVKVPNCGTCASPMYEEIQRVCGAKYERWKKKGYCAI